MTEPIVHLFRLAVAEENRTAFEAIGLKNLTTSQEQEPGTLAMYASPIKGEETVSYVFEVYRDAASYDTHRSSPQYQYFVEQAGPILTDRTSYEVRPIFLAEKLPAGQWTKPQDFYLKFAQLDLDPQRIADFQDIVVTEMEASIDKEAGVLAMYAVRDVGEPARFYFFEVYADEAAYLSHREQPHFQTYIEGTADMVEDKVLLNLDNSTAVSQGSLRYKSQL